MSLSSNTEQSSVEIVTENSSLFSKVCVCVHVEEPLFEFKYGQHSVTKLLRENLS